MPREDLSVELEPMTNRGRSSGGNDSGGSRTIKIVVAVLVILVVIAAIAVGLIFGLPRGGNGSDEESEHKVNCFQDGFQNAMYEVDGDIKFVKYAFVEPHAFSNVREECRLKDAELWEVIDGEPEWNALIQKAQSAGKTNVWLNGDVVGSCPDSSNYCAEDDASKGLGLAIRWPSSPTASYSRLYKSATPEQSCILVDKNSNKLLWVTELCNVNHFGICVKRDCIPE